MKTICLLSLSAVLSAAFVAKAEVPNTAKSQLTFAYRTRLIDTDQSQVETLSMADGVARLPASAYKLAGVHFITNDNGQVFKGFENSSNVEFEDPTSIKCKGEGYTQTSCSNGIPGDVCPYNSSYFKECCDSSYSYTAENCSLLNTTSSCGGKYKCDCDPINYPVTETSCVSPQVPSNKPNSSCVVGGQVRYSECVCPESYVETCNGVNVQGKGSGCSKNGATTFASCECKSGYSLTCSGSGNSPKNTSDYCQLNGIKYYKECNICPFNCTTETRTEGVTYDYEECSNKYCATGCAEGYVNYCSKPETDCVKLGYTKSVSQCPYGYLSCPYNTSAVFCDD